MTESVLTKLSSDGKPIMTEYVLTDKDIKGPFLKKIPAKLDDLKGLKVVSYRDVREELPERFHMSEGLLVALNAGTKFDRAGEKIFIVDVVRPD